MKQNIFLIGPTGCGKSTILSMLKNEFDLKAIDTGMLFRIVADACIRKYSINSEQIKDILNDELLLNEFIDILNQDHEFPKKVLGDVKFKNNDFYINNKEVNSELLHTNLINEFVKVVSKSNVVRHEIMRWLNTYPDNNDEQIVWAGNNIFGIDTSKFTTIFLDVTIDEAANRLIKQNKTNVNTGERDNIKYNLLRESQMHNTAVTRNIIDQVYNSCYIDTTNLSIDEVYLKVKQHLNLVEERTSYFNQLQALNKISKSAFEWIFNPFIEVLKEHAKHFVIDQVTLHPEINQNDLLYQTLIHLTSRPLSAMFNVSKNVLDKVNASIATRDKVVLDQFVETCREDVNVVNVNIIREIVENQAKRLIKLYKDGDVVQTMRSINAVGSDYEKTNIVKDNDLIFKEVDNETSEFIARNCHYLHTSRNDEYASYGFYEEGKSFPIAWVSFSLQDRDYKKQALNYIGIEGHNTLEMTRAWCMDSAPKNIMSLLFQKSIDALQKKWRDDYRNKRVTNNLQAITTTINPNLSFSAASFKGSNFHTYALRPAQYSFVVDDEGKANYSTRRQLSDTKNYYFENQFNILPLNEMIKFVNINKENGFTGDVIMMDKKKYETVLKDNKLIGLDINKPKDTTD